MKINDPSFPLTSPASRRDGGRGAAASSPLPASPIQVLGCPQVRIGGTRCREEGENRGVYLTGGGSSGRARHSKRWPDVGNRHPASNSRHQVNPRPRQLSWRHTACTCEPPDSLPARKMAVEPSILHSDLLAFSLTSARR
jgi:hypothetical protein